MKKTFALVLVFVIALCAMSITASATSFIFFNFNDDYIGDWTTHGGAGNLSIVDGALLTSGRWNGAFKTAYSLGDFKAGTYEVVLDIYAPVSDMDIDGAITYTIHIVNGEGTGNLDGADYASANFVIPSGEWAGISYIFTLDTDVTDAILAINTIEHDPWARSPEFSIDNVHFGDAINDDIERPLDEEVEIDVPVGDETEDIGTPEVPVEDVIDTEIESPAETGLALAVVPMLVAAAAVVLSKKN